MPGSAFIPTQTYLVRLKKFKFSGKIWNLDFNAEILLGGAPMFNPFNFV